MQARWRRACGGGRRAKQCFAAACFVPDAIVASTEGGGAEAVASSPTGAQPSPPPLDAAAALDEARERLYDVWNEHSECRSLSLNSNHHVRRSTSSTRRRRSGPGSRRTARPPPPRCSPLCPRCARGAYLVMQCTCAGDVRAVRVM